AGVRAVLESGLGTSVRIERTFSYECRHYADFNWLGRDCRRGRFHRRPASRHFAIQSRARLCCRSGNYQEGTPLFVGRFERPGIGSVGDSYRKIKEHPSPDLPANRKRTMAITPTQRVVTKPTV